MPVSDSGTMNLLIWYAWTHGVRTAADAACLWLRRVFFILGAALSGCGDPTPTLPRLAPGDVVLAFGDSLTFGTGAQPEEAYPEILSELIGFKVVSSGVPGEQAEASLLRLREVLDKHSPKILLLCIGGNDMLRKIDESVIEANVRRLVRIARQRNISVLLIGVPKPALFAGTAAFYGRIAKDLDLPYEGQILGDLLRDNQYKSDPIHPNASGYRILAQAIASLLREAKAIPD